jgi:uncharacterized protein YjbJ (UPF0337 family)
MNKDRVEGKVKDIAGRIERQAGEWTGDPEKQLKGAAKQVAGKVQNALGRLEEDASKKVAGNAKTPSRPPRREDSIESEEHSDDIHHSQR